MHSFKLLSAAVALGASLVSAQDTDCSKNFKITEPNPVINCPTIKGNVVVDKKVAGGLILEGVKKIDGDLVISGATELISISSSSIGEITGVFELNGLEKLSGLDMQALRSLNEIKFVKLPQLNKLTFGTSGVTKAKNIRVSDTRIDDLSGLNVATVTDFQIDNNQRLNTFNSDLVNITGTLIINNNGANNGNNMIVNMTMLEDANEIQVSNVKSFTAPSLTNIEQSLKFDKNPKLTSFKGDKIAKIGESLTFINNKKLSSISFSKLTEISGDLTVQNNTALEELDGFPKLESVYGAILLTGAFEKVELPKLDDVSGTVTVSSTTDIEDFCKYFDDAKSSGSIRGDETCDSNDKEALEGSDDDSGNDDSGDSGSGSDSDSASGDEDDAAGIVSVNMALLGLAAFAGIAQLF